MEKTNVCVVGVGNLGQHHARIYSQMENVCLAGCADTDSKKLSKVCSSYKTQGYTDYTQLLDKVDAVSVVVPTTMHFRVARDFLLNGVHCFVEKPLTTSVQEAEELISLAEKKNLILQVGHIERFNAAILSVRDYIKEPKFIEASRLGPYDPRVSDVGVVLDLMIHDLDIVLYLVNSKVTDIESYGTSIFSSHEDIVKVRLKFENGCIVDLSASRATFGKYRKLRIFQPSAYISIDYSSQRFRVYRKKTENVQSMKDIEIISPRLAKVEPLRKELEHFIECSREGKTPMVSGEHGRDALELALEILKKLTKTPASNLAQI